MITDQEILDFIASNFPEYLSIYLKSFAGAYLVDKENGSYVVDLHRTIAEWASKQHQFLEIGED